MTALRMRSCQHRLPWERGRPARMQASCQRYLIRQQHPYAAKDMAGLLSSLETKSSGIHAGFDKLSQRSLLALTSSASVRCWLRQAQPACVG